jgi:hypothetical protein
MVSLPWLAGRSAKQSADGSVRFVPQTIEGSIWRDLGTVAGGEVIAGG